MTAGTSAPDRRVRRTLDALRAALVALMTEKDWDEISVQDICDRANVGRSTFYTHFDDKGALLLAGFEDLRRQLRAHRGKERGQRLGWARGLIDHAYEQRDLFRALLGKRSGHLVTRRFRRLIAELIKQDLARPRDERIHADAVVHYVAGAFLELLTWWIDARSPLGPDDIEHTFRRMTEPALAAVL
ncbi:MAG: TetR/AcrR family transcriptional regulator [Deltaproteobacteria bacterium]|nr:TetR/AcrR family transcriptional regulator [Kofleriaceae bacterium]